MTRSIASEPGSGASRTSNASASPMRRPLPYSSMTSAVSRAWVAAVSDISAMSSVTARACSGASARGTGGLLRGVAISLRAGLSTPCRRARKRKKLRTADRWRERVALPAPSPASAASQARRSAARSPASAARSGSPPRCCVRKPRKRRCRHRRPQRSAARRGVPAPATPGMRCARPARSSAAEGSGDGAPQEAEWAAALRRIEHVAIARQQGQQCRRSLAGHPHQSVMPRQPRRFGMQQTGIGAARRGTPPGGPRAAAPPRRRAGGGHRGLQPPGKDAPHRWPGCRASRR